MGSPTRSLFPTSLASFFSLVAGSALLTACLGAPPQDSADGSAESGAHRDGGSLSADGSFDATSATDAGEDGDEASPGQPGEGGDDASEDAPGTDDAISEAGAADQMASCLAVGTCTPGACQLGTMDCEGGVAECTVTSNVTAGTPCDAGAVCNGGTCQLCASGTDCTEAGTCQKATIGCSTGSPVCAQAGNVADGTSCGANLYCNGGSCAPCTNGASCTPSSNPCDKGSVTCSQGQVVCNDQQVAATNGTACGTDKVCNAGACVSCAANVVCTPTNVCHVGLTSCATGVSVCVDTGNAQSNGQPCNDGNACTQTDTCQSGICTGAGLVTCTASDQCHGVGTCNTSTGACSNPALNNGTSCNDSNACTRTDTCQNGVCTGASPVTCTASDQCHGVGTCNTSTGACSNPALNNGTSCNDSNACTRTDTCQNGVCTGASPVTCTASDQCHGVGTCNTSTGACSNPALSNGTSCNDGNACTQSDTCQGGVCTGASPVTCTASDQCHGVGTCNTSTGACTNPALSNGTSCNDGNACTQSDTCESGVCTGANPVTCIASDSCHGVGACNATTGKCSNPALSGNSCGTNMTCVSGTCECSTGYLACSSTCVAYETDPNNCGTCSKTCSFTCASGSCSTATSITAYYARNCILLSDGTAQCWGDDEADVAIPVSGISSATALSAGGSSSTGAIFACALQSNGIITCWGDNSLGQLGDGTNTSETSPSTTITNVSGLKATYLASGATSACAVLSSGAVECWGDNSNGQLGVSGSVSLCGTSSCSTTPVPVSGISSATTVSVGIFHTCALLSNGTVQCWGANYAGELGNNTQTASPTPVNVAGLSGISVLSGITAIAAGGEFTCAIGAGGKVYCWGDNRPGSVGVATGTTCTGTSGSCSLVPVANGVVNATALSTGVGHACALLSGGTVECWGANDYGQVGNGATGTSAAPTVVSALLSGATGVTAGAYQSCAIVSSGTKVECWGDDYYGELGDGLAGSANNSSVPVVVK